FAYPRRYPFEKVTYSWAVTQLDLQTQQFRFLLLCYAINMYAADEKVPVLNHPCEPKIFPEPIAIQRSTTSPHQLL
ncbi:hypothetical protein, partial [Aeromonas veronii]|uniref:hypothetical protein n=1 Tax=Aeromonas veronii TaxID=654 RepID=UPI00300748EC